GIVVVSKLKHKPAPVETAAVPAAPVAPAPEVNNNSTLRVFADLEGGKFSLDDQPAADLQEGQLSLENLAPGKHTFKITGAREQATITFDTEAGAIPKIQSVAAKEALAIAITSLGTHARLQSSGPSAKVAIDGKPAGETGESGLDLADLAQGN